MINSDFYEKLGLDEDLLNAALTRFSEIKDICEKQSRLLLRGKCKGVLKLDFISRLAVVLYSLPSVYQNYKEKGIDDNIFFDTFSDIKIWCANAFDQYGEKGLENIHWITKHLSMKIFRIGRLQFEFSRFLILPHAGLKNIIRCPYRLGEKCITLHIPQGEKLDNDKYINSFQRANEFFKKYYPSYKYRCYTVITWLLNPDFRTVLGKDSNIVKFANMFTLLGYVPDSDMNERRVFGYKKDRKNYRPKNALQRYTLDRINKGKPLLSYNGFVEKNLFNP